MKKYQWFVAGTLAVLLLSALAACGSTGGGNGPGKEEQAQQEQQEAQARENVAKMPDEELANLVELVEGLNDILSPREYIGLMSRIEDAGLKGVNRRRAAEMLKEEYTRRVSAEAERRANLPVTEDDFEIRQNQQGTITITKYTGQATRVTIPAAISGVAVTEFVPNAFARNTRIISVVIPEGVTDVPGGPSHNKSVGAFEGCSSLQSVLLPSTLKSIDEWAFAGSALTSLTLPDGLREIGDDAFYGERTYSNEGFNVSAGINKIQTLVIPDSVISIGRDAFRDCGIQTLKLGSGLTTIGISTFADNRIKDLTIPDSVTAINAIAFVSCGIETLNLGKGLTRIGRRAFASNQIAELTIPAQVTTIEAEAFSGNRISALVIPNSVTNIEEGVFKDNRIAELTIPAQVKTIGEEAFSGNQISALVIPNGVTLLGRDSFANNPLVSVTIPPSLAASGNDAGFSGAFSGMTTLTSITLPANVDRGNLGQFGEDFINFYTSQGRKAGTYVKNGRIWMVQ
jgi:predicted small lipoprotein YifL